MEKLSKQRYHRHRRTGVRNKRKQMLCMLTVNDSCFSASIRSCWPIGLKGLRICVPLTHYAYLLCQLSCQDDGVCPQTVINECDWERLAASESLLMTPHSNLWESVDFTYQSWNSHTLHCAGTLKQLAAVGIRERQMPLDHSDRFVVIDKAVKNVLSKPPRSTEVETANLCGGRSIVEWQFVTVQLSYCRQNELATGWVLPRWSQKHIRVHKIYRGMLVGHM